MAEVSSQTNTVQELVENGGEIPQSYNYGTVELIVPENSKVPVIDMSKLVSDSTSAMDEELLKLREALSSWGCLQIINHGIGNSFMDEVRRVAKEFFHLPMTEKQKYARDGDGHEGYGTDLLFFEKESRDWNDRLLITLKPEGQRKLKYWPQSPPSFGKVLLEYKVRMEKIQNQLLKSMAMSLGLPDDSFLEKFGEQGMMHGRFNYYPPCSKHDQVLGLKPHTDGSALTILMQDEQVQGLQLLKDDQWFWVPIIPNALVVNLGDQLEIMSNGIFKSPVHRAVISSQKERCTVAMFANPDPSKDVGPLEKLIDDQRPRLFKNIKNYTQIIFQYYQLGQKPIDAVRV